MNKRQRWRSPPVPTRVDNLDVGIPFGPMAMSVAMLGDSLFLFPRFRHVKKVWLIRESGALLPIKCIKC